MKKKIILFSFIAASILCFTGCDDGVYDKSDVKKYLVGKGYGKCSIGECVELEGNNRYWEVYDEKNDMHFNVLQEVSPTILMADIDVYDNYDAKLVEKHLDEFSKYDGVNITIGDIWDSSANMEIEFADLDEMEANYNKAIEICETLDTYKDDIGIDVYFKYTSPRAEFYRENNLEGILDIVEIGHISSCSEVERGKRLELEKETFLNFGYKYRFPEIESIMTEADIENFFADKYTCPLAIYRSGDPDDEENTDYEVYEDIYCSGYINYGNLYYLLINEGFSVEGTIEDYTVYDVNGRQCEFSYDFAGNGDYGTYYLVDGEVVSCDANYFQLYKKTVEELFGLKINEYSK